MMSGRFHFRAEGLYEVKQSSHRAWWRIKKLLRIAIPLCVLLGATLYLARLVPSVDLRLFLAVAPMFWVMILLLFLLVQILTIWYYKIILNSLHAVSSLAKLSLILFASHSLNYAGPFKLGTSVRILLFNNVLGVPYTSGAVALVLSTGIDVFVMVTLVLGVSIWLYVSAAAGVCFGVILIAIFVALISISQKLQKLLPKLPSWLGRFLAHFIKISAPTALSAICLSIVRILLNSLAGWVILMGLGADLGFVQFTFASLSAMLAGFVSLIPMGLGVRDASAVELLGRMGTSPPLAIAFVGIDRLVWSGIPLVLGLIAGWQVGVGHIRKSLKKEPLQPGGQDETHGFSGLGGFSRKDLHPSADTLEEHPR